MKSHAQAVVIGGGVVGCSVLYHLTKAGWRDVVLVERKELTAGSTWHAAGGAHTLNGDPNVAKLQKYTIELYKEIEEISGQSCGLHVTGGVALAGTPERLDWLKMAEARGRYLGLDMQVISPKEAQEVFPLLDPKHFIAALYDPLDLHLDPSGTTHAYAKSARINGAEIYRQTMVRELVQRADGTWDVVTDKGTIHAEHVVNAGGLWAREVGRMVGLELPLLAMEHMYLLTEDMAEVKAHNEATGREVGHAIDFEGELYLRQERGGMLMGTYERACVPWAERETPWDFEMELLPPDLDRIAPSLEIGFEHFPAFQNAGIKQIICGPFTFAPDGNPLVGPVRGLRNFWCACGVMAGFSQGGGVGLTLSNWMVHGDPGSDIWGMDVARFGDWATMAYTNAKVRENYSRRFRIRFPNEELTAARPLRTTAIYDRLKERGAVFGVSYGIEQAMWFAGPGEQAEDVFSFRRSTDFAAVAREVAAVREAVGLIEISSFAKYRITGPGAAGWLDRLLAGRLPKVGRMALAPMLNEGGRLIGDFTLARDGEDGFYLFGSGVAEQHHMRWFESRLPASGVSVSALGLGLTGLSIAGPKSRELLQRVAGRDVSNAEFGFMAFEAFDVGMVPALVGRVSFTGDLGYEIWVRPDYLRALHDTLCEAGRDLGLAHFGSRALNALRLEKGWGSWAREYRPIYTPFEAGLDRFVALQKPDFTGRQAAICARDAGPRQRLVTMAVEAGDADVIADEPIWSDGAVVGWVTSGGYAHHARTSVAMGYVRAEAFDPAGDYAIETIGQKRAARVLAEPLFDPHGARMRG